MHFFKYLLSGILFILLNILTLPHSIAQEPAPVVFEFDTFDGLEDDSQGTATPSNYSLIDGKLEIFTRAGTNDRAKVKSIEDNFGVGRYQWQIDLPEIGVGLGIGDQTSIGAFIFSSDEIAPGIFPELDFEIGYGTSSLRNALGAQNDDLVVYAVSQNNPSLNTQQLIKHNATYDFEIRLTTPVFTNGNYYAEWFVGGTAMEALALNYGPDDARFSIFASMENLSFIGDQPSTQDNVVQFESMKFGVIPEPKVYGLVLGSVFLLLALRRKLRQAKS